MLCELRHKWLMSGLQLSCAPEAVSQVSFCSLGQVRTGQDRTGHDRTCCAQLHMFLLHCIILFLWEPEWSSQSYGGLKLVCGDL